MSERVMRPGEEIYDLFDVVEEGNREFIDIPEKRTMVALVNPNLQEEMIRKVTETTERVAREMFPAIAERIIREEIDKLKQ
ncbi:MAG: hypothetical protein M0Q01_03540 [Syntrophales bacterium]|jgi:hypothetical protein|nr:hypothetical protein [Syntrophales bacterium]